MQKYSNPGDINTWEGVAENAHTFFYSMYQSSDMWIDRCESGSFDFLFLLYFKKQSPIMPVYWNDSLNKACYASLGEIDDNSHVVADNYGQKAANGAYYPHGNAHILF